MITKKVEKSINKWERDILKSLKTGRGLYSSEYVADLHDWLKLINLIRKSKSKKVIYNKIWDLDSLSREAIPSVIFNFFESDL